VSANILMTKKEEEMFYQFWDMSDMSANPKLIYTHTDCIDRRPAIRVSHLFKSANVLLFEGTMQLWDWSTKQFVTNKPLLRRASQ